MLNLFVSVRPLFCASVLCACALAHAEAPASMPSVGRQQELRHLLKQDCGACHGMTLQGGLGTPLTRHALRDKPAESLVATILQGRPGTAMPPWAPFMSDNEARWLVQQLMEGHAP